MKARIARIVRIITIPPILVTVFLLVLNSVKPAVFSVSGSLLISIIGLGLLPVLSYAVWALVPALHRGGRDSQRKTAFVFSLVGYIGTYIYGRAASVSPELMLILTSYLLSAIILAVLNYLCKIKASGHACSITGPLALCVYFIGWISLAPCLVIEVLSFWASLQTGRHTWPQLLTGAVTALAAFGGSLILVFVIPGIGN